MMAGAALVTYLMRALGVVASGRLNVQGPLFDWIRCVAYALLAALISRMVFLPSGNLAETPLWARLVAVAVTLVAFYLTRRNLFFGVAAGFATIITVLYAIG
ncbi:MAG: AzlD domain-containing protein [Alphaproteobacteria bacterium]|nr:AzlD domain-containing protein [Alphaproteobacteria bacterium]